MGTEYVSGLFVLAGVALTGVISHCASAKERRHVAEQARDDRRHAFRMVRWTAYREAVGSFLKAVHVSLERTEAHMIASLNLELTPRDEAIRKDEGDSFREHSQGLAEVIYWAALLPPALQDPARALLRTASDYIDALRDEKVRAHAERRPDDIEKIVPIHETHEQERRNFLKLATEWIATGVA